MNHGFTGFFGGWPRKGGAPAKPEVREPKILEPRRGAEPKGRTRESALGRTVPAPVQLGRAPKEPGSPLGLSRNTVVHPAVLRPGPARKMPAERSGIAIVGRFHPWPWGQHPDEAYLADRIEALGVKVFRVDQASAALPVLEAEWAVFTAQPSSWGKLWEWAPTHRTVLWTLDWLPDYPDRRSIIDAAKGVTVFATSDRFDWSGAYGMSNHFYLPGACEGVKPEFSPHPVRKCAFMGSIYNERRKKIAETVKRLGGEVLDSPSKWVYGLRLAKFVQSTKVIVGDNVRNDIPGYWSSRNYVIPGAGGFLLTAAVPGLESDLEPGVHACVYGSPRDLAGAIEACAAADRARETIRRAGFEHVRKNHGWAARAAALVERMGVRVPAR